MNSPLGGRAEAADDVKIVGAAILAWSCKPKVLRDGDAWLREGAVKMAPPELVVVGDNSPVCDCDCDCCCYTLLRPGDVVHFSLSSAVTHDFVYVGKGYATHMVRRGVWPWGQGHVKLAPLEASLRKLAQVSASPVRLTTPQVYVSQHNGAVSLKERQERVRRALQSVGPVAYDGLSWNCQTWCHYVCAEPLDSLAARRIASITILLVACFLITEWTLYWVHKNKGRA